MALRRRTRDEAMVPARRRGDDQRRALARVISDGRLDVCGQPIVDLTSGTIAGVDVDLRLPPFEDTAGEPPPDPPSVRSILSAADDDLVVELNRCLVNGLRSVASVHPESEVSIGPGRFVSVAVDQRFMATEEFLATVKEAVRGAALDPSQLLLSVDAKPGFEPLWPKLQRLKSHGVRVAVDDFAPGSSSADLVRRYPFDVVRFACPPIHGDADDRLAATVKLVGNLGCRVIVDQVATSAQLDELSKVGAHFAVGPLFGSI